MSQRSSEGVDDRYGRSCLQILNNFFKQNLIFVTELFEECDRAYLINQSVSDSGDFDSLSVSLVYFMNSFPRFLRSLLLTSLLSFAVPMLTLGVGLAIAEVIAHLPGLTNLGESVVKQLLQFLSTFGSGRPLPGAVVIGLTCSVVGVLFDIYALSRYQNPRGRE